MLSYKFSDLQRYLNRIIFYDNVLTIGRLSIIIENLSSIHHKRQVKNTIHIKDQCFGSGFFGFEPDSIRSVDLDLDPGRPKRSLKEGNFILKSSFEGWRLFLGPQHVFFFSDFRKNLLRFLIIFFKAVKMVSNFYHKKPWAGSGIHIQWIWTRNTMKYILQCSSTFIHFFELLQSPFFVYLKASASSSP